MHPDTGKRYRWLKEPDWLIGMPSIASESIRELIEPVDDEAPADKEPLGLTLEQAASDLEDLQDWADDRETWVRVGMALKHEFDDDGWDLFDEWSEKGRGYDPKENWKQWCSFKQSRSRLYTMRSIRREARDRRTIAEFNNDEDLIGSADADEPDPYDEEDEDGIPKRLHLSSLAKYRNPDRLADVANLPDRLRGIPGFLDMFVDHYMETARKPQRMYGVMTALALGSIACSRVWITENENHSNLFINIVGESGSGKEHPKKFIQSMLDKADLGQLLGPRSYSASAGIRSYLYRHPRHVIIYDEFGTHLSITKASQDTNRLEVRVDLMEIFGQLNGKFTGKSYSENSLPKNSLRNAWNLSKNRQ